MNTFYFGNSTVIKSADIKHQQKNSEMNVQRDIFTKKNVLFCCFFVEERLAF